MESSYFKHLDAKNLCGQAMSQKLPLNGFEWVEQLSQFKKDIIKDYDEKVMKSIFLKYMLNIQQIHLVFIMIYHFYLKGIKFKNVITFLVRYMIRKTMLFT